MGYRVVGDPQTDKDNLVLVLDRFQQAYQDFDAEPHPDEIGELSSWSSEALRLMAAIEDYYGTEGAKDIARRAWEEVKR